MASSQRSWYEGPLTEFGNNRPSLQHGKESGWWRSEEVHVGQTEPRNQPIGVLYCLITMAREPCVDSVVWLTVLHYEQRVVALGAADKPR
jgi:hypothetical protein